MAATEAMTEAARVQSRRGVRRHKQRLRLKCKLGWYEQGCSGGKSIAGMTAVAPVMEAIEAGAVVVTAVNAKR